MSSIENRSFDREQRALWARLNAFIEKLSRRHTEILEEAGAGLAELLRADPKDVTSIQAVVQAVRSRSIELRAKMNDTFSDDIQDAMMELNWSGYRSRNYMDLGIERIAQAMRALEEDSERFQARWTAAPYRWMWPEVKAALLEPASCSQCGVGLEIDRRRSQSIPCPACGAVNQFIPEPWMSYYFQRHGASRAFADEWAIEQRLACERYRERLNAVYYYKDTRKVPVEKLDRLLEMEKHYWVIFGQIRQRLTGETDEELAAFIQPKIDQFIQTVLMTEHHWKLAKGL